jgi:membrane protein required for colicin V production
MTWLDYALLGVVAVSIGWGVWRGLVREMMSLASWIIAFLAANLFAAPFAEVLPSSIVRPELRALLSFVTLFVITLVLATLAGILLAKLVRSVGLGNLDRLLGALFGLLRGLLIVLVVAIAAGFTSFPRSAAWKESLAGAQLAAAASGLKAWLPPAFADRMKYN